MRNLWRIVFWRTYGELFFEELMKNCFLRNLRRIVFWGTWLKWLLISTICITWDMIDVLFTSCSLANTFLDNTLVIVFGDLRSRDTLGDNLLMLTNIINSMLLIISSIHIKYLCTLNCLDRITLLYLMSSLFYSLMHNIHQR